MLGRDDTARTINSILSSQVERFLVAPIGPLTDHMPAGAIEKASSALTEKLSPPPASVCRRRSPSLTSVAWCARRSRIIPIAKLEALVLSVAQHHLKTIELFGALIGFWIGVGTGNLFLVYLRAEVIVVSEPRAVATGSSARHLYR